MSDQSRTILCTPQADQWQADCEAAGWAQHHADRAVRRTGNPLNDSALMAVFLPIFGAFVALLVFA